MGPGMEAPIYWNWLAFMCLAAILVMVRTRQEALSREIDSCGAWRILTKDSHA